MPDVARAAARGRGVEAHGRAGRPVGTGGEKATGGASRGRQRPVRGRRQGRCPPAARRGRVHASLGAAQRRSATCAQVRVGWSLIATEGNLETGRPGAGGWGMSSRGHEPWRAAPAPIWPQRGAVDAGRACVTAGATAVSTRAKVGACGAEGRGSVCGAPLHTESDVEDRHVVAQILADRRWPWAPS